MRIGGDASRCRSGTGSVTNCWNALLLAVLFSASTAALALDADFEFGDTLTDESQTYTAAGFEHQEDSGALYNAEDGFRAFPLEPAFGTEDDTSFVSLVPGNYLELPPSIPEGWDAPEPVQISLRFRFTTSDPGCCDENRQRLVLATHDGDPRVPGFSLKVERIAGGYWLLLYVGGGTDASDPTIEGYGYRFRLHRSLTPGAWIDFSVVFRLNGAIAKVETFVDGVPANGWLSDPKALYLPALIEHLNAGPGLDPGVGLDQTQLFVGGFPTEWMPMPIGIDVDRLTIIYPRAAADSAALRTILDEFRRSITGEAPLDEADKQSGLQTLLATFNGEWGEISDEALAYIDAYETAAPPLFAGPDLIKLRDMSPEQVLLFYLQQWMFEDLLGGGTMKVDILLAAIDRVPVESWEAEWTEDEQARLNGLIHDGVRAEEAAAGRVLRDRVRGGTRQRVHARTRHREPIARR